MNTARRAVAVAATLLTLVTAPGIDTAVAHADDTPGCATHGEFRHIKHGMSPAEVRHIVGARGNSDHGPGLLTDIGFRTCRDRDRFMFITFFRWDIGGPWHEMNKSWPLFF